MIYNTFIIFLNNCYIFKSIILCNNIIILLISLDYLYKNSLNTILSINNGLKGNFLFNFKNNILKILYLIINYFSSLICLINKILFKIKFI